VTGLGSGDRASIAASPWRSFGGDGTQRSVLSVLSTGFKSTIGVP
jgi:hypothetical protein